MGVFAQIASGRGATCMPDRLARLNCTGVTRRPLKETVTMDLALVVAPRVDPAVPATLLKSLRAVPKW
jgi:DNA-binding transcriptional LysR family regulator